MPRNFSIPLGDHFETFITNLVLSGRFKHSQEAIEAGLRLLEVEEAQFDKLKVAIKEGIDSGLALTFDPQEHLAILKSSK